MAKTDTRTSEQIARDQAVTRFRAAQTEYSASLQCLLARSANRAPAFYQAETGPRVAVVLTQIGSRVMFRSAHTGEVLGYMSADPTISFMDTAGNADAVIAASYASEFASIAETLGLDVARTAIGVLGDIFKVPMGRAAAPTDAVAAHASTPAPMPTKAKKPAAVAVDGMPGVETLSPCQLTILRMLGSGKTVNGIAEATGMNSKRVYDKIRKICTKLSLDTGGKDGRGQTFAVICAGREFIERQKHAPVRDQVPAPAPAVKPAATELATVSKTTPPYETLSLREVAVMILLGSGKTVAQSAKKFDITETAIYMMLARICKKLSLWIGCGGRPVAVAQAGKRYLEIARGNAAPTKSGTAPAPAPAPVQAPAQDREQVQAQDPSLSTRQDSPEPARIAGLSVPQFQIFKLIGQGLSINEIATTRRQDLAAVKDRVDKLRRVFKFKTLDELVGAARSWRARMDKGAAPLYIRGLLVPATHTATELYIEKDLSPIQFAVLRELGAGKNPADIAARRHLSVKSVMHSIKVLHDRLKLKGRTGQTKSEVVAAAGAVFLAQEANEIAVMKAPAVKPAQPASAPIPAGDIMQQGARS
jgi:DNA-binding NarL/FixJ family response regulator